MKITILKDIQLRPDSQVFTRRCSHIIYDAKNPRAKKLHQLLHQQGERYGTVGDYCEYLNQDQLEKLAADGFLKIEKREQRPAPNPEAQYWHDLYDELLNQHAALVKEFQALRDSMPPCIQYPKELPEQPTCVWLHDGTKIAVGRDGRTLGPAWLRIEKAAKVIELAREQGIIVPESQTRKPATED